MRGDDKTSLPISLRKSEKGGERDTERSERGGVALALAMCMCAAVKIGQSVTL